MASYGLKITTCPHLDHSQLIGDDYSRHSVLMNKLPNLGPVPCTTFCSNCSQDVHTKIDFLEHRVFSKWILSMFGGFFHCCSMPKWLNKLRVHKCPSCAKVLAKSM